MTDKQKDSASVLAKYVFAAIVAGGGLGGGVSLADKVDDMNNTLTAINANLERDEEDLVEIKADVKANAQAITDLRVKLAMAEK